MMYAPYYVTQTLATLTGQRQQPILLIHGISFHPNNILTEFPWSHFQEKGKASLTSESLARSVGQRFLLPMGDPNLIHKALSVDFLVMPQEVEITRFKMSCPVKCLCHVMLFLKKVNHTGHWQVWGSRFNYPTMTLT